MLQLRTVVGLALVTCAALVPPASAVTFSEWTVEDAFHDGQIQSISVNPSSPYVWFGSYEAYTVGFITPGAAPPNGLTQRLDDADLTCNGGCGDHFVTGVAVGPDGRAWFSQGYAQRIGRIGPTGPSVIFDMPNNGHPSDVTVAGDGTIWFQEDDANRVARVATTATQTSDITEFTDSNLSSGVGVRGLTTGPDGALYFSEGGTIARMAMNGTITNRYPLGGSVTADQLEWGPDNDGNTNWIWFIRGDTDGIGRLDPATGNVDTNFTKPGGTAGLQDLAAGPDGRIYITATNSEHIVRFKPGEALEAFATGANTDPYSITAGPDGNMWFGGDHNPGVVGRINIQAPQAATLPATSVTGTGATLNASANSRGSTDATYQFAYATNPALTGATTTAPGGMTQDEAAHVVSTPVAGLTTGTTYFFRATATNSNGSAAGDVASFTPGSPQPNAPVLLTAPQIGGTPQVGNTLVCSTGTWTNTPTVYTYQWSRAGQPIAGASTSDYTLVDADADQAITCAVSAANGGGSNSASSSAVTPTALAPANQMRPSLDGFPRAARQVTCDPGDWSHNPNLAVSWELDGTQVATGTTYTPPDSATGHTLVCRVTATTSGGTASATSTPFAVGIRAPFVVTAPKLTGDVKAYEKVTCQHGAWSPAPIHYDYEWAVDDQSAPGSDNAPDYIPRRESVGKKLTCKVTAFTDVFTAASATTEAVAIKVGPPVANDRPAVFGTGEVGRTLHCYPPIFEDRTGPVKFQWYRWTAKIAGATSADYKITADDSGAYLACQVIATGPGGTSQTLSAQVPVEYFVRNMRIKGIEVTQGIQESSCFCVGSLPGPFATTNFNKDTPVIDYQGVRLSAGKWLVVRVWADYVRDKFGGDPLEGVTARLEVKGASGDIHTFTPDSSPASIPEAHTTDVPSVSLAERADAASSFNFLIPWQDTNYKTMHFRATLGRIPGKGPWQCDGCGANQFVLNNVPFVRASTVPIHPYPIAVNGARTDATENSVFDTTDEVLPNNVSVYRWAAPIEVKDIMNNAKIANDKKDLSIAAAVAKRASDDKLGRDDYPVGVFDYTQPNMGNGVTLGGRALHQTSGPPVSMVPDKIRPIDSVMHEIGHGLSLAHADTGSNCGPYTLPGTKTTVTSCPGPHPDGTADCKGNSLGQTGEAWPPDNEGRIQGAALDRRAWEIYKTGSLPRAFSEGIPAKADIYYDFMSYCVAGDQTHHWISVRNWERLLDYAKPKQDQPNRAVARQVSDPVRVIAVVDDETGAGSIFDVAPGQTATGGRQTGSAYGLELRDAAGNPLTHVNATATVIHADLNPQGTLVEATLPLSAGAASVALTDNGATIAQRARSAHPPTARVTAPKGGARVGAGKTVTVTWTAADGDGDTLTTTVDYSADGGRTWKVIADGVTGTSATVPRSALGASRNARVRVRVNDGFDTATATSKRFTAVGVPPQVRITTGVPGGKARADDVLELEGTAFDDTGRPLTGKALRWFTGKRQVGRGAHIAVRGLPAGKLRIRLVARDKKGRTGSDSFALSVAAVVPEFLTYVAPEKLARTARKVKITLSTTVPATLQIGGKRYSVGRTERKIKVRFKPGKKLLALPYVLRAGAKKARGSLQFKRG